LLGRHLIELGVEPGPRMGQILKAVYELQLDGIVQTLDEARARAEAISHEDHEETTRTTKNNLSS
jgi:hypothetical protein